MTRGEAGDLLDHRSLLIDVDALQRLCRLGFGKRLACAQGGCWTLREVCGAADGIPDQRPSRRTRHWRMAHGRRRQNPEASATFMDHAEPLGELSAEDAVPGGSRP